jgi:hypothetical protein
MSHGQASYAPYSNLFESCHVKHGDDNHAPGIRAKCGKCGVVKYMHVHRNMKGQPDDEALTRKIIEKLEAEGWKVGNNISHHRCPDCVKRAAQMRAMHAKESKPMNGKVVELPRQMQRADRRVVFAKLEDVYKDEVTGYTVPWNDVKVAEDLGIPVEWVKTVREENFGMLASNPQVAAIHLLRTAIDIMATDIEALQMRFIDLHRKVAELEK